MSSRADMPSAASSDDLSRPKKTPPPPLNDDSDHAATETTALLPGPSSPSLAPSSPESSCSFSLGGKRFRPAWPSAHTALFALLALLLLATCVILPIVYLVYIPHRLRDALSGNNSDIKEFRIVSINSDSVDVHVRAVAHNEDVPPVQVTMQPTLFSFLHIGQQQRQEQKHFVELDAEKTSKKQHKPHHDNGDGSGHRRSAPLSTLVGSMQFPGLVIPKGSVDVPFEFESTVAHLDVAFIQSFLRDLLGGGGDAARAAQVFRMQASPMMSLQRVGSWVVPMENTIVFDQDNVSAPNASQFNITVISKDITFVSAVQYKLFANLTFTNPTAFSFAAQNVSVLFSIYYENSRIVDMVIPPTTNLVQGINTNATVSGLTVPSGWPALMKLVGEYAAPNTTTVRMRDFKLKYHDDDNNDHRRERLPWVSDLLREVDFEVEIPGASEEDEDDSFFGSGMLLYYASKVERARKGVARAAGLDIPATNDEFWTSFYTLPESAEDVFNLFAPKDIRRVRDTASQNLETLFHKILNRLFAFVNVAVPPSKDDIRDVLNCVRILTRLLPYAFEAEDGALEQKLFWSPAEGEDALGLTLVKAVVQLLFYRGFTLPLGTDPLTAHGVQYIIWQQGVGASASPPTTRSEIVHRTEVLRLLLTLLSRTVYIPTAKVLRASNKWGDAIACSLDKKATLSVLCSTLNTVCNYDPVGWALLPYNHLLFADVQEQLVTLCLQTLIALLDIRLLTPESVPSTPVTAPGAGTPMLGEDSRRSSMVSSSASVFGNNQQHEDKRESTRNDFVFYAGKLHRPQDFALIINGFARILKNPLESANTYLPGSTKRVNVYTEVLMLFWKLLDNNAKFAQYAMESDKILVILASILYFAVESRNDPSQVGFVRMCAFMLHVLSQERSFSVQLNTTFDSALVGAAAKAVPTFTAGSWADFFFLAVHTLCTTPVKPPSLPLHEPLLTALANVSPYIKTLTVTTSTKLLSLFSAFSNPAFMLANEHNHKNVFFILEVFNNLIQYQVTGNTPLIYGVVRHKQKFYDLHDLTFEHAQAELVRVRALRAKKQSEAALAAAGPETKAAGVERQASDASTTLETADDEPAPLSAKAKGKMAATISPTTRARQDRQDDGPPPTPVDERGKFLPSEEWFNYWHSHLPLHTLLTLVDTLAPTIEQLCVEKGINDDRKVLEYLESGTLVGVLPVPHPIFVRKFVASNGIRVWFCGWFWVRAGK
ncbi:cell wall biogenesis protein [Geranomyces michiganensis]|nr:cell wall biogenesis protein [Geranomyces michiganensis]